MGSSLAGTREASYRAGAVEAAAGRIRVLAPPLREAEQRMWAAAAAAASIRDPASAVAQFLFVYADRLRNLAGRLQQHVRTLPELPEPPADLGRLSYWFLQMERDAARTGNWVQALEELSLSASLLALESSLTLGTEDECSRRLVGEVARLADELSRVWASVRGAAAELAWAARDATRGQQGQGEGEE